MKVKVETAGLFHFWHNKKKYMDLLSLQNNPCDAFFPHRKTFWGNLQSRANC